MKPEPKCEFCGKKTHNGRIISGELQWCSQRHYLAWLNEQQTWEDESGVVRDPDSSRDPG